MDAKFGLTSIRMRSRYNFLLGAIIAALCVSISANAQIKRKKSKTKAVRPVAVTVVEKPAAADPETVPAEAAVKKYERPSGETSATPSSSTTRTAPQQKTETAFRYEFTQPEFTTSRIVIEHDETGAGTISFERRGIAETFTDPIRVSTTALKRLNEHFGALNFLDSNENYQIKRDYSHLGNVSISRKKDGRERSVSFNYTENKHAKALADSYRAIANQALWIFDIAIARANQPLESPNQMKHLEMLIKRNEISDPEQMLPLLRELSDDERLPLIARNNASRIIQLVEKASGKK